MATGMGTYCKDMKNLIALWIARRNAYVQGFIQAKNSMAELVSGIVASVKTNFDSQTITEDTDTVNTRTQETSTSETIRTSENFSNLLLHIYKIYF